MDAYHYSFTETGTREIDLILSAVACAGKAYHNTDCWDDAPTYKKGDQRTEAGKIQDAGAEAAQYIKGLEAQNDKKTQDLSDRLAHEECKNDMLVRWIEAYKSKVEQLETDTKRIKAIAQTLAESGDTKPWCIDEWIACSEQAKNLDSTKGVN